MNYVKKIALAREQGLLDENQLGAGIHDLAIYHDDWCGIYKGRPCNCDPDLVLNGKKLDVREEGG